MGYATPEAALQSAFWAIYTGDLAAMRASYAPEKRKEKAAEWEGKTGAEVSRELLLEMPADFTLPVDHKRVINDREVAFVITHDETQGTLRFHDESLLTFPNLAGEWKISQQPQNSRSLGKGGETPGEGNAPAGTGNSVGPVPPPGDSGSSKLSKFRIPQIPKSLSKCPEPRS